MPFFLYHPRNKVAQILQEANEGKDGFIYRARQEMEMIIRHHMEIAKIDISPQLYMHIGSLAGPIDKHLPLDEENELHRLVKKSCQNPTPWSFVKLDNGPNMRGVIGFCNSDPTQPFLMSSAQMAQKGLISATHIPTAG